MSAKNKAIFPQNFLADLKALLLDFGLGIDDWCITGEYALLIQGYNIMKREKHLDIFVKSQKLKWQIREVIQTIPPVGSKELEEYSNFIEKYKFGLHLIPIPKRKVDFNFVMNNSIIINQENVVIKVLTVKGYVKDILLTLKGWEKHEFGERFERCTVIY